MLFRKRKIFGTLRTKPTKTEIAAKKLVEEVCIAVTENFESLPEKEKKCLSHLRFCYVRHRGPSSSGTKHSQRVFPENRLLKVVVLGCEVSFPLIHQGMGRVKVKESFR